MKAVSFRLIRICMGNNSDGSFPLLFVFKNITMSQQRIDPREVLQ